MHSTVFDTPIAKHVLRGISLITLKLMGWRKEGRMPEVPRCLVLVAPHTSNWDFPLGIALAFSYRLRPYWIGKDSLFHRPFGALFKWLAGIPVDRHKPHGLVAQMVQTFEENPNLVMAIAPEGTRSGTKSWKSGFYHVARGAGVPVVLGFLDYHRKVGGFGPTIHVTGDVDADMRKIRDFYANIVGKHPDQTGTVNLTRSQE